jgi:hypothetical protein
LPRRRGAALIENQRACRSFQWPFLQSNVALFAQSLCRDRYRVAALLLLGVRKIVMSQHQLLLRCLATSTLFATLVAVAVGVVESDASAAPAQSIAVPCPSSISVTPALNANLISNPGAETTTPFPASYNLPPASANEQEPDCWAISGQSTNPGGILSALAYVPAAGNGLSAKPEDPSTPDPNKGINLFYGGIASGPVLADSNVWSYASQAIDLSRLRVSGQRFLLSGYLGGLTTQSDYAEVSVLFETAGGKPLEPGVPFQIGPVTPAQRSNTTSLVYRQFIGAVPFGAAKAVVTIATEQVGAGPADDDGMADDLNLTIGSSVPGAPSPTLATLPWSFPIGSGGGLVNPQGISAAGGNVYVSNTADDNVADLNTLPAQAAGATTPIFAGSLQGNGEQGDGGPASRAALAQPGGTTEDARGDVFIADTEDNVIRKVSAFSGTISRVAGNGTEGSSGLRGPATRAELDSPEGVAVNALGDLFIADTFNNRIVEVLPDGELIPFAGDGVPGYAGDSGPASQAELDMPTDVAVDAFGNVYIADASNNVIRRVDGRTGRIATVAGNFDADQANGGLGGYSGDGGPATSAQLSDPEGIALDSAGDLFIADTFNNAIREVTPGGAISTVVNAAGPSGSAPVAGPEVSGSPTASGLNGPVTVAVDNATHTLYIADTSNNDAAAVLSLAKGGFGPGPGSPPVWPGPPGKSRTAG